MLRISSGISFPAIKDMMSSPGAFAAPLAGLTSPAAASDFAFAQALTNINALNTNPKAAR